MVFRNECDKGWMIVDPEQFGDTWNPFFQGLEEEIKKKNQKRAEIRASKSFRDRLSLKMEV